jgi:GT2 family glycosyltransferase
MDASVIIPTYNGASRIAACLEALLGQHAQASFEIIVVDDGSADDTPAVVQRFAPRVRLIRQANAGPAAARNHGVREASGDVVLFIDDDCIAQPDWLAKMLAPFADGQIAGAKGAYLTRQRQLTARFVQVEYEEKYDCLLRNRYIDFIDTYSAAFRRDVFVASGGYDERFATACVEDQEFSFRLAAAGHKMVFIPDARVWHTHVPTVRGYWRKKLKIGYWKVLALIANPSKIAGDSHTPQTLKMQIALVGLLPLSLAALAAWPWGLVAPAGVMGIFLLTAVPLTLRCLRRDWPVGLAAPAFIAIRAAALATGLLKGMLHRRRLVGQAK